MRRLGAGVPDRNGGGRLRRVHSNHETVLRQWHPDLQRDRPVGDRGGMCGARDVCDEWEHGGLHVCVLDMLGKGHRVPGHSNASYLHRRREQMCVRLGNGGVPYSRVLLGCGSKRCLQARVLE